MRRKIIKYLCILAQKTLQNKRLVSKTDFTRGSNLIITITEFPLYMYENDFLLFFIRLSLELFVNTLGSATKFILE